MYMNTYRVTTPLILIESIIERVKLPLFKFFTYIYIYMFTHLVTTGSRSLGDLVTTGSRSPESLVEIKLNV